MERKGDFIEIWWNIYPERRMRILDVMWECLISVVESYPQFSDLSSWKHFNMEINRCVEVKVNALQSMALAAAVKATGASNFSKGYKLLQGVEKRVPWHGFSRSNKQLLMSGKTMFYGKRKFKLKWDKNVLTLSYGNENNQIMMSARVWEELKSQMKRVVNCKC